MNASSAVPAWLQILWAICGVGMAAGALLWVFAVLWPYIQLTKRIMLESLDLGRKTSSHLDKLQAELTPVISDLKGAVSDARAIVKELREKELDKIIKALDAISADGKLDGALESIRIIPSKLDEALKAGRKDVMRNL